MQLLSSAGQICPLEYILVRQCPRQRQPVIDNRTFIGLRLRS